MKLRTLDELNVDEKTKQVLKEEAMKWCEELDRFTNAWITGSYDDSDENLKRIYEIINALEDVEDVIYWIEHFFNINYW